MSGHVSSEESTCCYLPMDDVRFLKRWLEMSAVISGREPKGMCISIEKPLLINLELTEFH
ncbi:hypothetical protein DAPPUDRAFT_232470 [Daphnia pulex]|uniref:Uncharacterized protein n=1 Tax=Daphnia pulex TaxID=6669 RepID=E9FR04_DAPPU|nr:hypothetical protein DAPPUDRAFT_232470 [Daphnia pulex]|eukprot:EFX90276.1 hypothetical protein DAPPUDRAFT_232470 [Daphnia pulex]